MAYNIIKGKVEFSNSSTGSIESLVDDWRNQTIGGVKTFSSTVSASAFWDTTAGGEVRALKSLIAGDGANRVLTSDGDGTLTAESKITFVDPAFTVTGHITGSTFSGSAHGLTGIILNPDHLAATNYDGLTNRLSASYIVQGLGISSSLDNSQLQVTGGQGITVDTEGVRVLTASNGGLAFTGQTLQVDASKTTNKGGGPSNDDEFIIADSSDSDSIKNLSYSQIKTAITDSISIPITSYTNNGNNRVVTSVNSTTVNAEANLLFDGTTLSVSGAGSGQRGSFSVSGTADMPLFFVDGFQKRVAINNDAPGVTLQVTDRTAAPIVGIHRSASSWYSDGDDIGDVAFAASALGATYGISARIRAEADGSEWNSTSYPSRLTLWTSATGSSSPTQRMVINNSGNVGINTATPAHTLTVAGTVSASLAVSALSFTGDGSGLTGVTGEWDGSHNGDASITGSLHLTNALTSASGITGSSFVSLAQNGASSDRKVTIINGQVSASHTVTATSFVGDGSSLTGVSAPGILTAINASNAYTTSSLTIGANTAPNHKVAVSGAISASLNISASGFYAQGVTVNDGSVSATTVSASNTLAGLDLVLDAGGTGKIGVIGDTDLMTLSANTVTVAGAANATTVSSSTTLGGLDLVLDPGGTGKIGVTGDTDLITLTADTVAVAGAVNSTTLSASSTVNLVGPTNLGKENQTTVSNVGVLSSSATATLANATLDRITVASADINGGNIDGTVIGAASAVAGTFLTVSASSTLQAAGVVTLVNGKTTVSAEGVLSSSATATLANAALDKITLQEINTVPGGAGAIELLGALNTTSHITSSGGIHATGSSPRLAIGDKGGVGPQDGMLFIRPSDTSNKVLALFQAAEADGQRTCFGVTGSGQVLVGGLHLGGVFNVSGSDDEKLISAKSNTLNPAFTVSGSGDMFVGRSTYLSGAVQQNYVVKTTSADTYISGATDRVAIYTLSSPHNAYLPALNDSLNGLTITIKSSGTGNITVTGSALTNQLIDGNANKVLEQGDAITLLGYNGVTGYEWIILDYFDAA